MSRLPYTISSQSLTFYIKGRPFSLTKDHGSYDAVRAHLAATDAVHDPEWLKGMVDVRAALFRESQGRIVFDGDEIIFQGKPLHNVWVDKILDFRHAGEDFSPIWNALDKLVQNPTPAAIERLPIFLERSKLGFLPDGRFVAFKGVQADYCSAHRNPDGTRFTHQIGDKPRMPREAVDPNPNNTCSTGLHVGAPGYVRDHYSGGTYALVLVAVDPVDVVSVPTDYSGEKMRVCGYEVIDHLEQDYSDEILGKFRNTVTGYSPEPETETDEDFDDDSQEGVEEEDEPYDLIEVGDVIEWTNGVSLVIETHHGGVWVRNLYGAREHVSDSQFYSVVEPGEVTAAMVVTEGCLVRIQGDPILRDGEYSVVDYSSDTTQADGDEQTFSVAPVGSVEPLVPVLNGSIETVSFQGEHLWPWTVAAVTEALMVAEAEGSAPTPAGDPGFAWGVSQPLPGDLVEVTGEGWPPAGVYPVIVSNDVGVTVQTEHDGVQVILADRYGVITSRPWMRAEVGGTVTLAAPTPGNMGSGVGAGTFEVVDVCVNDTTPTLQVRSAVGPWWVAADRVTAAYPKA